MGFSSGVFGYHFGYGLFMNYVSFRIFSRFVNLDNSWFGRGNLFYRGMGAGMYGILVAEGSIKQTGSFRLVTIVNLF